MRFVNVSIEPTTTEQQQLATKQRQTAESTPACDWLSDYAVLEFNQELGLHLCCVVRSFVNAKPFMMHLTNEENKVMPKLC